MSPILDLPQRYQNAYRIRLGDQEGNRPHAFTDRMRITAPTRTAPDAFAEVFGTVNGLAVAEWDSDRSNDKWEVYLPVSALRVWLLPGNPLEQWWERYRGKVCDRRCDGFTETLDKTACLCPSDLDERMADKSACAPMSRLSVFCPDVNLRGTGDLVTHSQIAAETMRGSFALAAPLLRKGVPVEGNLYIHTHRGRTNFSFPVLQVLGPVEGVVMTGEAPELGPSRPGQGERGDHPVALEAGAARQEDSATSAVPPPTDDPRRPFDESDAVLFGLEGERWLVGLCRDAGLSEDDIFEVVMAASGGRTGLAHLLYKSEKDAAKRAFAAAVAARPSEPVEVVG